MAIGPREQQLRDMRAAQQKTSATTKTRPSASAPAKTEGDPVMETAKTPSKKKAAKSKKKSSGGKKAAAAPGKAKAVAAPDGAWRQDTIGAVAREAILAGKTNEEALAAVKRKFPDGKTNLGNMSWYRNDLRAKGLLKKQVAAV